MAVRLNKPIVNPFRHLKRYCGQRTKKRLLLGFVYYQPAAVPLLERLLIEHIQLGADVLLQLVQRQVGPVPQDGDDGSYNLADSIFHGGFLLRFAYTGQRDGIS